MKKLLTIILLILKISQSEPTRTTSNKEHRMIMCRILILSVLILVGLLQTSCEPSAQSQTMAILSPPPGVDNLNSVVEEVRARYGLPGIAVAVFNVDSVIAVGSAGTRKVKSRVPLIYTDKIQIASIAKTMTATIVAFLVEDSLFSWESTLADLYPELVVGMEPAYRTVTVEMLLRHSGGVPRWMRHDGIFKSWERDHRCLSATEKRYEAVKYILAHPTEYPPGSREYYTNDSFLVLGNICERVSGKSCEELFHDYIFRPLEMTSFGFGEPWVDRTTNNPWGHEKRGSRFVPYDPDPVGYGKIPFGTPYGGIVHGSVVDLAKYGIFHLRGDLGLEPSLSPSSFHRLHHADPPAEIPPPAQVAANGFYNEGWIDKDGYWTNIQHWGYYARGRTLFWFSRQAKVGVAILTNGTEENESAGMQPIKELAIQLVQRYRLPIDKKTESNPTAVPNNI